MYKCDKCNYVSNRIFNFKKHKNRKNPCYQNEQNISLFEQNISLFEQNISLFEQNISSKKKLLETSNDCKLCNKVFFSKSNLNRHLKVCKGVDSLTCPNCHEVFQNALLKYRHIKKCKKQTEVIISPIIQNNNIQTNITNHITNNNITNNNIHINCFGKEDLSYLLEDNNLIYRIYNYSKDGVYGLVKMIDEIYMNKDKPENNTIIKLQDRGEGFYIRNNNEWEYREYEDIRDNLVSSLDKYIDIYQQKKKGYDVKLIEKKERVRIKKFLTTLMTIGGMLNEELCKELEIDETDIHEVDDEKTNKKFDNATKEKIHQRSNIYWKKVNGEIQKMQMNNL
jgi:hypothetical protein